VPAIHLGEASEAVVVGIGERLDSFLRVSIEVPVEAAGGLGFESRRDLVPGARNRIGEHGCHRRVPMTDRSRRRPEV
jgi:hypothetical protein